MRVLVDTSVWSLALRKAGPTDHPTVRKLQALLLAEEEVVLTGIILQEILQAFRQIATVDRVRRHLQPFLLLPLERRDHEAAAALHRRCAAKGITATTADCQIAAAAIRHRCLLLTADEDFGRIARHSSLKLA